MVRSTKVKSPTGRKRNTDGEDAAAQAASPWEWAVAAVGALILVAVLVVLGREALFGTTTPPDIRIEQIGVEQVSGGHLVRFRARNSGGRTAAEVYVTGRLIEGGNEVDYSQTRLDYLPQDGVREGGLFFTRDPEGMELELRATGYAVP